MRFFIALKGRKEKIMDKEKKESLGGDFINEIDKITFISKALDALSLETDDDSAKEVRPDYDDMKGASDILREVGERLSAIHEELC